MTRNMKRKGWVGASAALALTASGLLAPAVAFAVEADSIAPTTGPDFDATAKRLMTDSEDIQAVAKDAQGRVIVYSTADEADLDGEARTFVDTKSNVVVERISSPITALAATDVVGGAGYFSPFNDGSRNGAACSVGFSGWSPEGAPAVITAGHCNGNGAFADSLLTLPTSNPAGGAAELAPLQPTYPLGTVGFTQFGGPGNTAGADQDVSSVDFAAINVTNDELTLLPEITDWSTASTEDLSQSTSAVTSVGGARAGESASKSGRTTGLTSGTVTGVEGWAPVGNPENPEDVRWVYGFAIQGAPETVLPGDSGGAVFQGTTAIGVVSGGDSTGELLWAADLRAGLAVSGGYSVAVKIEAPALTTPADSGEVGVGGTIGGTTQPGTTVRVTPESGSAFEALVDEAGNWSFPAPDKLGTYAFKIQAVSGFNKSASVDASVVVKAEAPVIASPANGSTVENEVTSISGTGLAGATVTLSGDAKGSAKVAEDGTWSVKTDLGIGGYTITAVQTRDGQTSAEATSSFTVTPPAPTITGLRDGETYTGAAVPTSVSGTGVTGAAIVVTVNDAKVGETTVKADGTWSIVLPDALGEGSYAVVATQTVEGVSNVASVSFSVAVAPVPSPTPSGTPAPGGNGGGNGGGLAVTGMGDVAPLAWGAAVLLLGGFGALGYRKVRRANR